LSFEKALAELLRQAPHRFVRANDVTQAGFLVAADELEMGIAGELEPLERSVAKCASQDRQ